MLREFSLRENSEREGFEPSVRCYPYTRLAGEHLRPLGHLSIVRLKPARKDTLPFGAGLAADPSFHLVLLFLGKTD